jgi:osomolarity two-component system response regulator SKN7
MHLKAIQQMGKFPRALGAADTGIEEDPETSLAVQPSMNPPVVEDNGRLDPLAGMGLTQQQYQLILQGLVHGDSSLGTAANGAGPASVAIAGEKRSLEDAEDERDGKRGRFVVLE